MLTTIEAEIDVNENIRLLEPVKVSRKSRALVTIFNNETVEESVSAEPDRKGDIRKFSGMYKNGDPTGSDNEKIDADLARAYLEDYERSK